MCDLSGDVKFELGEKIWIKLPGYPHWPGRIEEPKNFKEKKKVKKGCHFVFFYGSHEVAVAMEHELFKWTPENSSKWFVKKDHVEFFNDSLWECVNEPHMKRCDPLPCDKYDILPEVSTSLMMNTPSSGISVTSVSTKSFQVGQKVWIKMTNYPAWPGRIEKPRDPAEVRLFKAGFYFVFFYGTHETASVRSEELSPWKPERYSMFRDAYSTLFADALWEIEHNPEVGRRAICSSYHHGNSVSNLNGSSMSSTIRNSSVSSEWDSNDEQDEVMNQKKQQQLAVKGRLPMSFLRALILFFFKWLLFSFFGVSFIAYWCDVSVSVEISLDKFLDNCIGFLQKLKGAMKIAE